MYIALAASSLGENQIFLVQRDASLHKEYGVGSYFDDYCLSKTTDADNDLMTRVLSRLRFFKSLIKCFRTFVQNQWYTRNISW
jgi:hypothetical protein